MSSFLVLLAAMCFALAAALQQRGQFRLARLGTPVEGLGGLFRLVVVPVWILGTLILLLGYAAQGAALDRGRLVVVQEVADGGGSSYRIAAISAGLDNVASAIEATAN